MPPANSPQKLKQREMLERRARVSRLRLSGVRNQRAIAQRLGVSVATINRDFAVLDAEYRQQAAQDIAAAKGLDLERIEELIAGLWDAAVNGHTFSVDRVVMLLQHRAKLLGLEAATRLDIEVHVRRMAEAAGLDPEEAVAAAEAIVRGKYATPR